MEINLTVYGIALPALISALVELAKRTGLRPRWAPWLSLCLGVAGGIIYIAPGDWRKAALMGIALGLSASGLYSVVKSTRKEG